MFWNNEEAEELRRMPRSEASRGIIADVCDLNAIGS
jgi:hypothetical protein